MNVVQQVRTVCQVSGIDDSESSGYESAVADDETSNPTLTVSAGDNTV